MILLDCVQHVLISDHGEKGTLTWEEEVVVAGLCANPSSSSFKALGSRRSSIVYLSSLSSTKHLKARFTACSLSPGRLRFSWKPKLVVKKKNKKKRLAKLSSISEKNLSHKSTSYLEKCYKLLNSALGHNDRFSPTQQTKAPRFRDDHFSARVPDESVKEESPCTGEDAVHVPRVPLVLLQLWVTEPSNIFLQGRSAIIG